MTDIRSLAAKTVYRITTEGAYTTIALDEALSSLGSERAHAADDRRLLSALVHLTISHLGSIDSELVRLSGRPLSKIKPRLLPYLRIGLCQLMYMDRIPEYAAVSATVAAVRKSSLKGLAGFVNGVLRNAARNLAAVRDAQGHLPETLVEEWRERDYPDWLKEKLAGAYGKERMKAFLKVFSEPKPLSVRINPLKAALADRLLLENYSPTQGRLLPDVFYLAEPPELSDWAALQEGQVTVQDEASCLAAYLTGVMPGQKVLDLCAAPGGKSCCMAGMMQNEGRIESRDLYEHRVKLMEENAERLGVTIMHCEAKDATVPAEADSEAYDCVLLDAPCSGLGTLRSKPDILLTKTEQDLEEIAALQRTLLETAARAVKKGGRLVYSTCTLLPEENEEQVEAFLKAHPEFEEEDLKDRLPGAAPDANPLGAMSGEATSGFSEEDGCLHKHLTLFPVSGGHDGFFVSSFTKH